MPRRPSDRVAATARPRSGATSRPRSGREMRPASGDRGVPGATKPHVGEIAPGGGGEQPAEAARSSQLLRLAGRAGGEVGVHGRGVGRIEQTVLAVEQGGPTLVTRSTWRLLPAAAPAPPALREEFERICELVNSNLAQLARRASAS